MEQDISTKLAELGLKIDVLPVDSIRPYERNSKKHGQRDLAAIYSSIDSFGFSDVIICDADLEIIAGHGRLIAAKQKGMMEVPVLICEKLNKDQAKAYRIAHNRSANIAKYDNSVMTEELSALKLGGFDLEPLKPLQLDKWIEDPLPEFNIESYKPPKPEELTKEDVPDITYPTDNDWEVPVLALNMQADTFPDRPVVQWGDINHRTQRRGTIHWYCEDDKFESLWKDPTKPLKSGARNLVEPNFSNYRDMRRAYVLGKIYEKRWISRFWQENGRLIYADMNVNERFFDLNMLGIPPGWRAYFTRGYSEWPDKNLPQYELAKQRFLEGSEEARQGKKDIIFCVYGGGKTIQKVCQEHGWEWIEDRRAMDRATFTKMFNEQNVI